jgi:hypothetical protein
MSDSESEDFPMNDGKSGDLPMSDSEGEKPVNIDPRWCVLGH